MFRILIGLCIIAGSLAGTVFHSGVPMPDGRIVGGQDAKIEDYPHQVSLEFNNEHICGGSVISPLTILTAAHCVSGPSAKNFQVRAASTNRSPPDSTSQVRNIQNIVIHEKYSQHTLDYDIAILTLTNSLEFNEKVQKAELATQLPNDGDLLTTTGWGTLTQGGGYLSNTLQKVDVNAIGNGPCKDAYSSYYKVTDRMVCAGVKNGGKDACQGDSGGPLMYNGQLVGIVSWGNGCGQPGYPGVYTSVPELRQFIVDNMKS